MANAKTRRKIESKAATERRRPPKRAERQRQKKIREHVCYRATNPRRLRHTQNAQRTRKSIWKDTPSATAAEHDCYLPTPLIQSMAVVSQSIMSLLCVSERHCYRAWLQFCSNLSIRHAPRGRCMKKIIVIIITMMYVYHCMPVSVIRSQRTTET